MGVHDGPEYALLDRQPYKAHAEKAGGIQLLSQSMRKVCTLNSLHRTGLLAGRLLKIRCQSAATFWELKIPRNFPPGTGAHTVALENSRRPTTIRITLPVFTSVNDSKLVVPSSVNFTKTGQPRSDGSPTADFST